MTSTQSLSISPDLARAPPSAQVFTTATFSVMILGRDLHMRKWRALTTLTLGVILISNEALPKDSHQGMKSRAMREFAIGMAASFGDVVLSGFASIYFEMVRESQTQPEPNPAPEACTFQDSKALTPCGADTTAGPQEQERDVLCLGPQPAAGLLVVDHLRAHHGLRQPDRPLPGLVGRHVLLCWRRGPRRRARRALHQVTLPLTRMLTLTLTLTRSARRARHRVWPAAHSDPTLSRVSHTGSHALSPSPSVMLRYSDSIMKTIATTGSIVLTTVRRST